MVYIRQSYSYHLSTCQDWPGYAATAGPNFGLSSSSMRIAYLEIDKFA